MVGDSIGDFIIQIKNAQRVGKESVTVPASNLLYEIATLLSKKGFVGGVARKGKKGRKVLEVGLLYQESGEPRVANVKRISKPGRRIYAGYKEMKPSGAGVMIFSTPKGVLTAEDAKKAKVGGEPLFVIES